MASQGKPSSPDPKVKKDYSTTILERKKTTNRLEVDEATNDDNSVVALHPDTMELFQLSHSARILSRSQKSPIRTRPTAQHRGTTHPRLPSNSQNNLRLARGLPAEASNGALHLRLAQG
jgi:hypothetical protein